MTYLDVDYQANRNVLDEALKEHVAQFTYISVFNSHQLLHLDIIKAKEKFVNELKTADLKSLIIRPNGFFSDMIEFFNMAKKGRVYLFGNGLCRANPIHGSDLAKVCVDCLELNKEEVDIGGPEILTQKKMALQAFEMLGKKPKITYIPFWMTNLIIKLARKLTSVRMYGPIEFFLTVLTMNMVAPTYGQQTLKEYFREINSQ